MKHIKVFLLGTMVMFFTTYLNANTVNMAPIISYLLSDSSPSTSPDDKMATPSLGNNGTYKVVTGGGIGMSDDPYQVGSGMYKVKADSTEYFSFNVTQDSCNIALIDGMNITSLRVYDTSWNTIIDTSSVDVEVTRALDEGTYTIAASTWHSGEPSLGIYSDCITEYTNTYIENMENGPKTFYYIKDLYKFNMSEDGNVSIDNIDGLDYASIYDADWNLIATIEDEDIELFSGNYFLIPTQYTFAYRDDSTDFLFVKSY